VDTATTLILWKNSIMVTGPLGYHSNMGYFEIFGVATGVALLSDLLVAYALTMLRDRRRKHGTQASIGILENNRGKGEAL